MCSENFILPAGLDLRSANSILSAGLDLHSAKTINLPAGLGLRSADSSNLSAGLGLRSASTTNLSAGLCLGSASCFNSNKTCSAFQPVASCLLKLIVNSVSGGAQQVAPNQQCTPDTIYNKSFELIEVSIPTKNKMCGASNLAVNEHKCLKKSDVSAFQSIVKFT